jgi:tRNA-dihydrouridine synthase A
MMQRTDRHFRYFLRQLTKHTLLYSEMITARAILRGDRDRLLGFDPAEHPVSLQLGGDDPEELAEAARVGEDFGYDEIDLNVGCPSPRVQRGQFGAALMARPDHVAACVEAMRARVNLPVTVKHRLGIDDLDQYEHVERFVEVVGQAGCDRFTVHARKAILSGLSPKGNRTVPPLRYDWVHALKERFPEYRFVLNGGLRNWPEIEREARLVGSVMVGRAAYEDPYLLAEADVRMFGGASPVARRSDVLEGLSDYAETWVQSGGRLHAIVRHVLPLFSGVAGARGLRKQLAEAARDAIDSGSLLRDSAAQLRALGL